MYLCIRRFYRSFAGNDVAVTHFKICVASRDVMKGKGKFHRRIGHEDPEGEKSYRSTLSLTSALDGVGVQRYAQAALPPVRGTHCIGGLVGLRVGLDRC